MIDTAVDAILVLVLVEGTALVLLHRRIGLGPAPRRILPNLAAGFLLMLAVRLALIAGPLPAAAQFALAAILGGALVAHVADLVARWRD